MACNKGPQPDVVRVNALTPRPQGAPRLKSLRINANECMGTFGHIKYNNAFHSYQRGKAKYQKHLSGYSFQHNHTGLKLLQHSITLMKVNFIATLLH